MRPASSRRARSDSLAQAGLDSGACPQPASGDGGWLEGLQEHGRAGAAQSGEDQVVEDRVLRQQPPELSELIWFLRICGRGGSRLWPGLGQRHSSFSKLGERMTGQEDSLGRRVPPQGRASALQQRRHLAGSDLDQVHRVARGSAGQVRPPAK